MYQNVYIGEEAKRWCSLSSPTCEGGAELREAEGGVKVTRGKRQFAPDAIKHAIEIQVDIDAPKSQCAEVAIIMLVDVPLRPLRGHLPHMCRAIAYGAKLACMTAVRPSTGSG